MSAGITGSPSSTCSTEHALPGLLPPFFAGNVDQLSRRSTNAAAQVLVHAYSNVWLEISGMLIYHDLHFIDLMDRNIDRELPRPHQVLAKEHLERPGTLGDQGVQYTGPARDAKLCWAPVHHLIN